MSRVTSWTSPARYLVSAQVYGRAAGDTRAHAEQTSGAADAWRVPCDDGDDAIDAAMQALQCALSPVSVDPARPVVAIPSYPCVAHAGTADAVCTGPDLTPLLACLLAGAGVQVVMHGFCEGPWRSAAGDVLRAMGLEPPASVSAAAAPLSRGDPAFVPLPLLSAALARCWERAGVGAATGAGVRFTLVDAMTALLNPTDNAACLRLIGSDGAQGRRRQLLRGYLLRSGAGALLMHGTGASVAAPAGQRAPIEWIRAGRACAYAAGADLPPGGLPALPPVGDTAAIARWIQSVLAGERPVPLTIAAQLDCVLDALASGGAERYGDRADAGVEDALASPLPSDALRLAPGG